MFSDELSGPIKLDAVPFTPSLPVSLGHSGLIPLCQPAETNIKKSITVGRIRIRIPRMTDDGPPLLVLGDDIDGDPLQVLRGGTYERRYNPEVENQSVGKPDHIFIKYQHPIYLFYYCVFSRQLSSHVASATELADHAPLVLHRTRGPRRSVPNSDQDAVAIFGSGGLSVKR